MRLSKGIPLMIKNSMLLCKHLSLEVLSIISIDCDVL